VFTQLATVEDRRLAEVLSAAYLGAMQVVVVKSYECIARLRGLLGAAEGAPTPSMLSYSLIQPFRWGGGLWGSALCACGWWWWLCGH